jgi:hypothetical protein
MVLFVVAPVELAVIAILNLPVIVIVDLSPLVLTDVFLIAIGGLVLPTAMVRGLRSRGRRKCEN